MWRPAAVKKRVVGNLTLLDTDGPGRGEAKGQANDQTLEDIDTDQAQKTASKAGFCCNCHII